MKVLKHIKQGTITYISHIDTMRVLQRTLVRAGIKVRFSEGFNPHPITYTSHPLPLGVSSKCEYFVIANEDLTADEVMTLFNNNAPSGIEAEYCVEVEKNPNLAARVNYCEYFASSSEAINYKCDIEALADMESYEITYDYKGKPKIQDIAPLIDSIRVENDGIYFVIAAGNPNLRPDRLINNIMLQYPLNIGINDITRIEQYIINDGKKTTVDEYINGLKNEENFN